VAQHSPPYGLGARGSVATHDPSGQHRTIHAGARARDGQDTAEAVDDVSAGGVHHLHRPLPRRVVRLLGNVQRRFSDPKPVHLPLCLCQSLTTEPRRTPGAVYAAFCREVLYQRFRSSEKLSGLKGTLGRALEHIHSSQTGVCCVHYVASGRRVKAQDSYLSSS
jgi:hypothetical protein